MAIFKANEKPKFEESTKMYRNVSIRQIRKADAVCVINGDKSDECKKVFKEMGLEILDE